MTRTMHVDAERPLADGICFDDLEGLDMNTRNFRKRTVEA